MIAIAAGIENELRRGTVAFVRDLETDGGHIENLGVYELLRRRCRVIICVDGGADPDFEFYSLTTLQRYANIDLDAKIDIDLRRILPDQNGVSKEHFAVGNID